MAQKEEKVNPLLDNIMENIISPGIDQETVTKMYDAWADTYDQVKLQTFYVQFKL